MKKRIYTNKELVLSFNEQVLAFNDEVLSFWTKGLTHFDVNAFTYTDAEMGEAIISFDLIVEPEIQPVFDRYWYVDFRGERFYLSTLTPSCVKDTTSLQYKYSLIFKSQRADLQRYEFANFVAVGSVQQPISYDFSLPITIQEFIERVNINLDYYFGDSVWQAVLDPSCLDNEGRVVNNLNTAIYDGISRVTVSFSRETLWSIITGIYDTFGLRWTIQSESGVMTIRIGATPATLQHTFEYGKDKGLVSIERINSNPTVYTRLSGRGSDRNLPYRYFDTAASDYPADPDNNTYTQLIPYTNIMPSCYRDYVKGWNRHAASLPADSSTYAYTKGYTDTVFNPVDYAVDEESEVIYGVRKGSVADTNIYPTLQGIAGDLDEVLAVEPVLNDDIESKTSEATITNNKSCPPQIINYPETKTSSFDCNPFELVSPYNKITFSVTQAYTSSDSNAYFYSEITVSLFDSLTKSQVGDSLLFQGLNPDRGYPIALEGEFINISAGSYYLQCTVNTSAAETSSEVIVTTTLGDIKKSDNTPYKQTFDIWVRNIWGTTFQDTGHETETEDEYMHRVWDPLFVPGKEMSVYFSSGLLAGDDYEFVIAKRDGTNNYYIYHETLSGVPDAYWRLSLIKSDTNYKATGLMLPNMTINAEAGDRFFFTNIELAHNPYVLAAEAEVQAFLENELLKVNNENPTYAIKPSSIYLETYADNASIQIGTKVPIMDNHVTGDASLSLTITNLTIEYKADKLLPQWDIIISEKPTSTKNSIQIIQGDVKVLSNNLLSARELTNQVQISLDGRYLRKDGAPQISQSPTIFDRPIKADYGIGSEDFASGQISGLGYAIYKDANGDYILEIDKLNIRKTLYASELVINQVSLYGGIHLYSAAAMTVSEIDDSSTFFTRCYLDIKQGTVLNQFVVGDYAYCKRFAPDNPNSIIKYYWKQVIGVGKDYIDISLSGGDGMGTPEVGDNIAQLGNASDIKRQSAVIIDQTNGGSTTQYAKISDTSLANKEYITYGVDPSTGRAYERIYGDFYTGGRNPLVDNYFKTDSSTGEISFRGKIRQESTVVDADNNESAITVDRGVFDYYTVYWPGNTVYWEGSTYYCDYLTTETLPSNTNFWHIYAAQGLPGADGADGAAGADGSDGADGAAGLNARKVDLTASTLSAIFNTAGILVSPSSILLTANVDNFTYTPYYQFYDNNISLGASSVTNTKTLDLSGKTFTDMPRTIEVEVREGSTSGPIMARDQLSITALKAGTDGLSAVITNQNHSVLADSDGNVLSYLGSGTMIMVYEGSVLLEYNAVLAPGKFAIGTPTVSPAGKITVGSITGSGSSAATIGAHSNMLSDQDILTITYPITVKRQDGVEVAMSVVQSINKTKQGMPGTDGTNGTDGADGTDGANGTDGADGTDGANGTDGADGAAARVVRLLAPATVVRYNSGGITPTPNSIDITAVANNTVGVVWYEFIKDNIVIQNTTSNTYSYSPPADASYMPDIIQVNVREDSSTGIVVASDMVPIIGLVANSGIIQVAQSNPFVQFASDYTGLISDYSKSSEIVRVYEGDQILTPIPTESEPSNGEWLIYYVQPVNINAGGRSIDGNDLEIGVASNMSTDTARVDYSIHGVRPDGRDFTASFYQGFTRFKDGADGKGYEYIYTRTTGSSVPTTPADGQTKSSSSPATTYQDDEWFPIGWTDDFIPPDENYIYAWISKRTKVNGVWGVFSVPKSYQTYVTNGADGADGYDSVSLELSPPTVILNCLANGDPRSGSLPFDVYILTKRGGILTDDDGMTITPASNSSISYTKTWISDGINRLRFTGITDIDSTLSISAYIDNGRASIPEASATLSIKKQLDGYAGPGLISRGAWSSTTSYTGSIQTVDVVSRKPSGSFIWYQAKTTAGSIPVGIEPGVTPGWDTYWRQLDSYTSVATDTLFAENANVAEFIFNGGKMYSQEPSTATLPNKNLILDGVNGKITAMDAIIKGVLTVLGGSSIGDFTVAGGKIMLQKEEGELILGNTDVDALSSLSGSTQYVGLGLVSGVVNTEEIWGNGIKTEETISVNSGLFTIPSNTTATVTSGSLAISFSDETAISDYSLSQRIYLYDSDNVFNREVYPNQPFTIPSGSYYVIIEVYLTCSFITGKTTYISYGLPSGASSGVQYTGEVHRSALCRDGFYIFQNPSFYIYFSTSDGLEVRFDNYILRLGYYLGSPGIWKSGDAGLTFRAV